MPAQSLNKGQPRYSEEEKLKKNKERRLNRSKSNEKRRERFGLMKRDLRKNKTKYKIQSRLSQIIWL